MDIELYGYKISPYGGNTCWKIQERQDKDGAKAEWKDPYYFPSTLVGALAHVRELARMRDPKEFHDSKALIKELLAMDQQFESVLKELKHSYPENFK